MLDLAIIRGRILDGTGNPWFESDIGILDGRIVTVGNLKNVDSRRSIDASGLIVAPGFIDMHTHSDLALIGNPLAEPKVMQGVTTEVIGNCGLSVAPTQIKTSDLLRSYVAPALSFPEVSWNWRSFGDYLKCIEKARTAVNVVPLVAHGTIRIAVMGFRAREANTSELTEMKRLLAESMEAGAFGMSSGLLYPPGCYASIAELVELCRVTGEYGGLYVTHIRNEGDYLVQSLEEAIQVAREARVPLHISHHKAAGKANWGKITETVSIIRKNREKGIDITCDHIQQEATSLPRFYPGGRWKVE